MRGGRWDYRLKHLSIRGISNLPIIVAIVFKTPQYHLTIDTLLHQLFAAVHSEMMGSRSTKPRLLVYEIVQESEPFVHRTCVLDSPRAPTLGTNRLAKYDAANGVASRR